MAKGKVVAVGHVGIRTRDLPKSVDFYRKVVGLKLVVKGSYFNAFEVGDAHFCIMPGKPRKKVAFDFTSDDVDRLHERLGKLGVPCTRLDEDRVAGHRFFSFIDPDGHTITVYSAHEAMPEVS